MIKRLDKLIIKSFISPFVLTFVVVVFILLTQYMLKYFDDFVGKNLGLPIFAELISYFSINMTPVALPLAILLSSLMTFGNLGEHFELTAVKSAGISLTRALAPLFIVALLLTVGAFLNNNYIVPKANLKAYSLLYDIKQKKPALDLKEGAFYSDIPGYMIKVNQKLPDGESLKDVIIYNHSKGRGNTEVTIADSGRMYTILNESYLVFELFRGNTYSESEAERVGLKKKRSKEAGQFMRNSFEQNKIVFSLKSFNLQRTQEELFANNRLMRSISQLEGDVDSMQSEVDKLKRELFSSTSSFYYYHLRDKKIIPDQVEEATKVVADTVQKSSFLPVALLSTFRLSKDSSAGEGTKGSVSNSANIDSLSIENDTLGAIQQVNKYYSDKEDTRKSFMTNAVNKARYTKSTIRSYRDRIGDRYYNKYRYEIEWHKKFAMAFACMVMFLIGAPLGSIIKKGGLGMPVILSIAFFIVYYVISMTGEKWARREIVTPLQGVWAADIFLLPFGLFFLRQAQKDARLFDSDAYAVFFDKVKKYWRKLIKQK